MSSPTHISDIPLSYYYFGYVPNHIANGVALGVFSILLVILVIRVFFSATSPKFMLLLPLTAAAEISGFAIRYVCSTSPDTGLFTAMSILLLLSANIMALVNYIAVGEVIRLSGVEPRYYILGPNFRQFFYKTNIVASILTGVGGGLTTDNRTLGSALTIVGVAFQLVFFCLFMFAARYVHTCPDYQYVANNRTNPKGSLMKVMYFTMGLLIIRSVYRLVNYIVILINPTDVHEWTYYTFDALLIALCFLVHCIWYLGRYLPSSREELNQKEINGYHMNTTQSQQQIYNAPPKYNNV